MRWLRTGGCGFIGTNLVKYLQDRGDTTIILDDLSRAGVQNNARYLSSEYSSIPHVVDVSIAEQVNSFFASEGEFDAVAHLAGQVSYLASLDDPRRDFEINALGTLNVLESVRKYCPNAAVIGMSSNKIYGDLEWIEFEEYETRYVAPGFGKGFNESLPIDMNGPYACSKGTADQYLADYARSFGLRTASFRQSSVYGPFQHPRSDQGWVAHLVTEAVSGRKIFLNGVGKQVRDLLHANDLARLIALVAEKVPAGVGWQVNVGGGQDNSLSILELFNWLESAKKLKIDYVTGETRPNDQKVFVSDNTTVSMLTGWTPQISIESGLEALVMDRISP